MVLFGLFCLFILIAGMACLVYAWESNIPMYYAIGTSFLLASAVLLAIHP